MKKKKSKYALEEAVTKFFNSARIYFFTRPKDKMDKIAHTMELISWILLGAAIIFRMR